MKFPPLRFACSSGTYTAGFTRPLAMMHLPETEPRPWVNDTPVLRNVLLLEQLLAVLLSQNYRLCLGEREAEVKACSGVPLLTGRCDAADEQDRAKCSDDRTQRMGSCTVACQ